MFKKKVRVDGTSFQIEEQESAPRTYRQNTTASLSIRYAFLSDRKRTILFVLLPFVTVLYCWLWKDYLAARDYGGIFRLSISTLVLATKATFLFASSQIRIEYGLLRTRQEELAVQDIARFVIEPGVGDDANVVAETVEGISHPIASLRSERAARFVADRLESFRREFANDAPVEDDHLANRSSLQLAEV